MRVLWPVETVEVSGEVVAVKVLGADGCTEPKALAEVTEEVTTPEGVVYQVLKGGASVAQEAAPELAPGTQGEAALQAEIVRLRAKGREVVQSARAQAEAAQAWQARCEALQAQVARQAGGRGQLASLPLGRALVPQAQDDDRRHLTAMILLAAGLPATVAALGFGFVVLPMDAWRVLWAADRFVLGVLAVALAARMIAWACGRPTRPWVPVVSSLGQYAVRVDAHGEAEVLCRRAGEESWRPAREFVAVPPGPAKEA